MQFISRLAAAWFAFTLVALPAQSQDLAALVTLDELAQSDPPAAIEMVESALRDPLMIGDPADPRFVHDLLLFRAELLVATGAEPPVIARAWADLGTYQSRHRDLLSEDPVPAFLRAATIFEDLADLRSARRALEAAIDAAREAGGDGQDVAVLYDELARLATLAGQPGLAEEAEALAATFRAPPTEDGSRGDGEGFRAVDVYYATDRARTGSDGPRDFYGSERGELELGVATVTIPDRHEPGRIEGPSVWRLEFGPSPSRHVILRSVTPVEDEAFYGRLNNEFADDPGRDLFVFIHGYNVTFDAAAKRAAQIAYDMGHSAVPVLFSWPSRGRTVGYMADTAVVRLSGRRLAMFLEDLVARSGAETIHIIAHSMGNRALTDALEILALRQGATDESRAVFGQVLFAAPDLDALLFAEMARTFRPLARRMTLYASEEDWALASSRKLHGAQPRAGQGGDDLLVEDSFDSIDMSELGEDMLAHSYFADDSSAIADMATLFWRNAPPGRRCGLEERAGQSPDRPGWDYRTGECASRDLIGVIAILREGRIETRREALEVLPDVTEDEDILADITPVVESLLEN